DEVEKQVTARQPLQEIVEEFGLSQLARMLLMLIVAPQMWGEIAQLYGAVANNVTRATDDEYLLRQLFGTMDNPHQHAYELGSMRPLRRFGLILTTISEPVPFTGLAPDPVLLARLRGEALDSDPTGELEIAPRGLPIDELRLPEAIVQRVQAAIGHLPQRPLRIVVRGRDGSGRRTLLASLAALAHRRLAMINLH